MTTPSTATLVYTLKQQGGSSLNNLEIPFATAPVPQDIVKAVGARLFSDVTAVSAPNVTRTVTLKLRAATAATLAAVLSGDGSEVTGVTVSAPGSGYVVPPQVLVTPSAAIRQANLRAYLNVQGATIVNGGGNYTAPVAYFQGGLAVPQCDAQGLLLFNGQPVQGCVQDLTLVTEGRDYSAKTAVVFDCALAPGGRFPTATLTLDANGSITGVLVTDTGSGLLNVPQVYVSDPGPTGNGSGGGTGGVLSPRMGVGTAAMATLGITTRAISSVSITAHGGPYVAMPKILITDPAPNAGLGVLVPLMGIKEVDVIDGGQGYTLGVSYSLQVNELYNQMFGNTPAGPFYNLMLAALEQAVASPVTPTAPAIT